MLSALREASTRMGCGSKGEAVVYILAAAGAALKAYLVIGAGAGGLVLVRKGTATTTSTAAATTHSASASAASGRPGAGTSNNHHYHTSRHATPQPFAPPTTTHHHTHHHTHHPPPTHRHPHLTPTPPRQIVWVPGCALFSLAIMMLGFRVFVAGSLSEALEAMGAAIGETAAGAKLIGQNQAAIRGSCGALRRLSKDMEDNNRRFKMANFFNCAIMADVDSGGSVSLGEFRSLLPFINKEFEIKEEVLEEAIVTLKNKGNMPRSHFDKVWTQILFKRLMLNRYFPDFPQQDEDEEGDSDKSDSEDGVDGPANYDPGQRKARKLAAKISILHLIDKADGGEEGSGGGKGGKKGSRARKGEPQPSRPVRVYD